MSHCNDVHDDLAELAAGDPAAIARHAEHLATCDACRDLRHEAERTAELAAAAGADYVPPPDLAARVLAAIDRTEGEAPTTKSATLVEETPAEEKPPAPPASIEKAREKQLAKKSKMPAFAAAAAAVALVAGASVLLNRGKETPQEEVPRTMPTTATGPIAESSKDIGTVTSVARASSTTLGGVTVKTVGDWRALAKGDAIPPGAIIKTDERTRVALAMEDGTQLVLDHDTELAFITDDARTIDVTRGRLVADVAHDAKRPASIKVPDGTAEILGTKVIVTAAASLTSVQVVRGEVLLTGASGSKAHVRAGEEGVIEKGMVQVASAPSMANEIAWTELEPAKKPDETISGVGALRAYKPGEKRDRDWNLALAKHDVKVRISGPIARTEITETFRNDSDETLEGVYQFPLPSDAQIDGLALDVKDAPGGFLEGAFLDKKRAAKIWQGVIDKATPMQIARAPSEIIWVPGRWRDPALLDWKRGGRFELKIFPIPAKGERTIKIAYTQVVGARGANRQYIYPLAHSADGSTVADSFNVDVEVRGAQQGGTTSRSYTLVADPARTDVSALTMSSSAFVPKGDLVIDYKATDGDAEVRAWTFAGGAAVAPDEKLAAKKGVGIDPKVVAAQKAVAADARPTAVLALRPTLPRAAESKPRDVMIVLDASQSMVGERWTRASELALSMIGQMDRRDRVSVSACDSECRTLGDLRAPTRITEQEAKAFLAEQQVAGSSDLVGSIRKAADFASEPDRDKWLLYIGDGFATTGFRRAADVERALASVVSRGVKVSTIGIGGDADSTVLSAAARGGGGSYLAWLPGQTVQIAALSAIESTNGAQLRDATVELPAGLADVAPTILPTLRAGEEILIAARLTGDVDGKLVLKGKVGNEPFTQEYPLRLTVSTAAGNAFVPRLWASLAINQLERRGEGTDRIQTVALSQGFGVMSKETSLLVLESKEMFDAFGVDRGQPTQKWSGEESVDEVVANGLVDVSPPPPPTARPSTAGSTASLGEGRAAPSATPPAPAPAKVAKSAEPESEAKAKKRPTMPKEEAADKDVRRGALSIATDDAIGDRPGMIAMRRTWVRVPSVMAYGGVSQPIQNAVAAAETALAASPDSREKHRALVQALSFAGDTERAREIAAKWLERDKLDPSALNYLADLLGRDGKSEIALRTLSGIIDLDADRVALHERMIRAYEASGRLAQACSHRITLVAISPKELALAGNAIRCLRTIGREPDAELIRRSLPDDKTRAAVEKLATVAGVEPKLGGDLVLDASWQGNVDLDISLITPAGERVSWMGGRKDSVARDAASITKEALALGSLKRGNYLVEITRGGTAGGAGAVRGTVDIRVLGTRRSMPFELSGERTTVARLAVTLEERLERVSPDNGMIPDRPRPMRR